MRITGSIKYLSQQQIDKEKWNACIDQSPNKLIYAYSFYLDAMALHWDALILNDYEAVMPLTWKQKWGIKYLYQPPLTPQTGIFSVQPFSDELIANFLAEAALHFKFAEIFFNYGNAYPAFKLCTNFILSLNSSYASIQSNYKTNLLRNLKKAASFNFTYSSNFDLQKALTLHQQYYGDRTPHVKEQDYNNFEKLCLWLAEKNEIVVRAVLNADGNLMAVAVLFFHNNRLYLIEPTTTNEGRDLQATHYLIDAIIQEFSEKEIILDMVGSDVPGIAQFYKSFGCIEQPFFFYSYNKLPWPLKILKR